MKNPHTHLGCKGFVLDVICYTACTFRCLFTPSESAKQDLEKEHNGGTENITDCIKEFFHLFFLQSPVKQRASPERTARLSGTNGV